MKQHHILNAMQNNFTTIEIKFLNNDNVDFPVDVEDADGNSLLKVPGWISQPIDSRKAYTYKALRDTCEVGDYVNILAPGSTLKVGVITEVHEAPLINFEADFEYKWIVGKIDLRAYADNLIHETELIRKFAAIERNHQRNAAMLKVRENFEGDSKMLAAFDQVAALVNSKKDTK